jgi:hypothetical protein
VATSPAGLKWRRAVAAASAISLFSTAFKWFTMSDEGPGAALVFGSPALVVGSLAAWWAWRGYAVRATPAVVVALLSALLGGGLTFIAAFAVLSWSSGGNKAIAGPTALVVALTGALLVGAIGFVRQRNQLRARRDRGFG